MTRRQIHRPLEAMRDELFAHRLPFLALIEDVLTPDECAAQIERMEAAGPTLATINGGGGRVVLNPRVRNNDRVIFDDEPLASVLFERLLSVIPPARDGWEACGLNERFRAYRYASGQRFAPHYDGRFVRSDDEHSAITVILYLNEGCAGGATRFHDFAYDVTPKTGMALLFDHAVLHEGCEVTAGLKYALRSDVMYRHTPR